MEGIALIHMQSTPTCPDCGWRGVPTCIDGIEQPICPTPQCKGLLALSLRVPMVVLAQGYRA